MDIGKESAPIELPEPVYPSRTEPVPEPLPVPEPAEVGAGDG